MWFLFRKAQKVFMIICSECRGGMRAMLTFDKFFRKEITWYCCRCGRQVTEKHPTRQEDSYK